jgi:hypothetical protein
MALAALAAIAPWGPVARTAAQSAPSSGYTYVSRVEQVETDEKGKTKRPEPVSARTWVLGDSARADIEAGNKDMTAGDYLLTTDGGRTVAIVSPKRKRYAIMALETFGQEMARELKGKLRLEHASVAPGVSEAGESLLGFATERRRLGRTARIKAKVLVFSATVELDETQEWWTSADVPALPDPLGAFLRTASGALFAVDSASTVQFAVEVGSAGARLPLRWRHRVVSTESDKVTTSEMTVDVTELAPGPVESGRFTIPADYKRERPKAG